MTGSGDEMDLTDPNLRPSSSFNRQQHHHHQQYSYPHVAQPVGPPHGRPPPPVPSNISSRISIKVALKPEYWLPPPPQLLPLVDDVPHSSFQFDFDLERRILEEAKKEGHSLTRSRWRVSSSSRIVEAIVVAPVEDPVVIKYTSTGLNKEAVALAIAAYGDVQTKVVDFVISYDVLREMGFEPDKIARALAMCDNDKERASAHLLG